MWRALCFGTMISIHAPREGSDRTRPKKAQPAASISIHAPREGSDLRRVLQIHHKTVISIHAPREGSDPGRLPGLNELIISIHAPREGSDCSAWCSRSTYCKFLSTLPARGATSVICKRALKQGRFLSTLPARGATCIFVASFLSLDISIHAPREGSDTSHLPCLPQRDSFLSTLPARGATGVTSRNRCLSLSFLSTLPARGATANVLKNKRLSSAAFV